MSNTKQLIDALLQYITPTRQQTLMNALQYRTYHFSVLLEDIYQPHNASAILRSCDAFGIQDVHILEQYNTFKPNQEVAVGSTKWVSIHPYKDTSISNIYNKLRTKGYQIIATTLGEHSTTLDTFNISKPSVLVFGNELKGLTQEAIESADSSLYIPMFGFVDSFNISVSVAIILSNIITRLHTSQVPWQISKEESENILFTWLKNDVHKSEAILQRLQLK